MRRTAALLALIGCTVVGDDRLPEVCAVVDDPSTPLDEDCDGVVDVALDGLRVVAVPSSLELGALEQLTRSDDELMVWSDCRIASFAPGATEGRCFDACNTVGQEPAELNAVAGDERVWAFSTLGPPRVRALARPDDCGGSVASAELAELGEGPPVVVKATGPLAVVEQGNPDCRRVVVAPDGEDVRHGSFCAKSQFPLFEALGAEEPAAAIGASGATVLLASRDELRFLRGSKAVPVALPEPADPVAVAGAPHEVALAVGSQLWRLPPDAVSLPPSSSHLPAGDPASVVVTPDGVVVAFASVAGPLAVRWRGAGVEHLVGAAPIDGLAELDGVVYLLVEGAILAWP